MIDHLSLGVSDLSRSISFYDTALRALCYVRVWTTKMGAGYGVAGEDEKLALFEQESGTMLSPGGGFHLAFAAPYRAAVDAFHAAAIAQGGRDAGGPGPRPMYGPTYYAAFVLDPDGRKLEAVHQ